MYCYIKKEGTQNRYRNHDQDLKETRKYFAGVLFRNSLTDSNRQTIEERWLYVF